MKRIVTLLTIFIFLSLPSPSQGSDKNKEDYHRPSSRDGLVTDKVTSSKATSTNRWTTLIKDRWISDTGKNSVDTDSPPTKCRSSF